MEHKKTYIIDIDGCIFFKEPHGDIYRNIDLVPELIENSRDEIIEMEKSGHMIILMTGRKEVFRKQTVRQLALNRIPYDMLIMGVNRGERIVINDRKPGSNEKVAAAIELQRNVGLKDII